MKSPAVVLLKKLVILFVFVCALLFFGCLGVAGESTRGYVGLEQPASKADFAQTGSNSIVYSSSASVKVGEGELNSRFESLKTGLLNLGARVSDTSYSEFESQKEYRLRIRISPNKFDEVNSLLKSAGTLEDFTQSSNDLNRQSRELDIRIENRNALLVRLRDLVNQSINVSQILEIERETSRIESELESLKAEKSYLDNQVELSTIDLRIYEEKNLSDKLGLSLDSLSASFIYAMSLSIGFTVALVGFLIPLGVVFGILFGIFKLVTGFSLPKIGGPKGRKPDYGKIPNLDD